VSRPFRRIGDRVRWSLRPGEVDLLRSLTGSLAQVLDAGDPSDVTVQRLFPRTVVGDDDADTELRGLIHDDLAGVKRAGLTALGELLDAGVERGRELRVTLGPDDTLLVLGVLNDLRLAIGARVAIERLDRDDVDPTSPVAYRLAVMDHLAGWQELLLGIVDPPAVRVHDLGLDELGLDDLDPSDDRDDRDDRDD
jgi:hypothetical protein